MASIAEQAVDKEDWQRLSQSQGTKGERLFDWAILPLVHQGEVDARHFLVVRRCLDDRRQLAYFLVWTPQVHTPLLTIVEALGARWSIEEGLQVSKDLGLDQYEVRSYLGWYRHVTLVLLAYAFLLGVCVQENQPLPAPAPAEVVLPEEPLIRLTPSEVRHLLACLFFPASRSARLVCQWSHFRRTHQYWAGYYHRRRREKAA